MDNTPDSWAIEAIQWAIDNGILLGDNTGDYHLHRSCTRQEMLVFLNRLFALMEVK